MKQKEKKKKEKNMPLKSTLQLIRLTLVNNII